jgi:SH3-like domain-containing protein
MRLRYSLARLSALIIAAAGIVCLAIAPQPAAGEEELPLPRFVSLKSAEVNLRTGPGTRYPIEWVYQRRWLPVEITAEFDNWRRVRDWQGTQGWVHRALLSGRRSALTLPPERIFRRAPEDGAPALYRAGPGVLVMILACDGTWCKTEHGETRAWTRQNGLWGVYPGEVIE